MCYLELIRGTERSTDNTGIKGLLSLIHWLDAVCNEGHLRQPDRAAGICRAVGLMEIFLTEEPWSSVSIGGKDTQIRCLSCLSQAQSQFPDR